MQFISSFQAVDIDNKIEIIIDSNLEVQRQEFMTEARESENNSSLSERISAELNGGVPLEENIRKQLEAYFNTDPSQEYDECVSY